MRLTVTIFFLLSTFNLFAQSNEIKREIKYTAEAGTILSTNGETPFWLRANQYGIVPLTSPIFTLRGSVSSDYKKAITKEDQYKLSKFDWGYGLNIVGNLGKESQFLIPEAYVKAKYGAFEIYAGRRREIVGLVDTSLTSGSYIWSGNALPIPKIQISTPNFVPLGITDGFLSFKGSYAHGWFENSRTDVKNFYLHQKSLYFRMGKPDWKFHFYGGFNHQVQWGGTLLYPDPTNQFAYNGQIGSGFNNYLNVVVGKSLGDDSVKVGANDAGNRSGNHLGTIDFGFEFNTSKVDILVYRQNIYETGTLYFLSNISDGMNGISIVRKTKEKKVHLNKIVFEYLNTFAQGGAGDYSNNNPRLRGMVTYFNNAVYREGWVYNKRIIGTPFILPVNNISGNSKLIWGVEFNRLEMFFVGLNLNIGSILVENKFSYARYFSSTNIDKLDESGMSLGESLTVNIPTKFMNNSLLVCSFVYNNTEFANKNAGIYVGICKKW